jgi:hypothetical protein
MTRNDHTRALFAYIARPSTADFESCLEAAKDCERAGMNLGMSSQIAAHDKLMKAAQKAVGNMHDHDVETIEKILAFHTASN